MPGWGDCSAIHKAFTLSLSQARIIGKVEAGTSISIIRVFKEGNYQVEAPGQDRGDEIGDINRALEQFKGNVERVQRMEVERLEAEKRASVERQEACMFMANDFESSVGQIITSVSSLADSMRGTAQSMADIASNAVWNSATELAGEAQQLEQKVGEFIDHLRSVTS